MKRTTKPKAKRATKLPVGKVKPKPRKATRSATTGRWARKADALADPGGTVVETVPPAAPPSAQLRAVVYEVKEILAAETLKPKTRIRRAMDRIMSVWHYVGG